MLFLLGNCDHICFLPDNWKVLQLLCTVIDDNQEVDEVTWQLFNHTVGHSVVTWSFIRPLVLNDLPHFVA